MEGREGEFEGGWGDTAIENSLIKHNVTLPHILEVVNQIQKQKKRKKDFNFNFIFNVRGESEPERDQFTI